MSKGSADSRTPNHAKRAESALWCECGHMRGGKECTCVANTSPLPRHPIMDALSEACGWKLRAGVPSEVCAVCGGNMKHDERIVFTNNEWRHWRCHKGGK